jgi:hypothetical protein
METFLNEKSLHSQFGCLADFSTSLAGVNRVLSRISELAIEKRVFFDPLLYFSGVVGNQLFSSCLSHITDKSVRLEFKLMRDRLDFINWHEERLHSNDEYIFDGTDVMGSSLAELAERLIQNRTGFLLNFSPSNFTVSQVVIVQRGAVSANLHAVNNDGDLVNWCRLFPELGLAEYDPLCERSPLDTETILINKGRFNKTNYRNHGRAVYQERSTSNYFCVDNLHQQGAHLEVFNANGDHIGEASLRGVLDASKVDRTKTLSL